MLKITNIDLFDELNSEELDTISGGSGYDQKYDKKHDQEDYEKDYKDRHKNKRGRGHYSHGNGKGKGHYKYDKKDDHNYYDCW